MIREIAIAFARLVFVCPTTTSFPPSVPNITSITPLTTSTPNVFSVGRFLRVQVDKTMQACAPRDSGSPPSAVETVNEGGGCRHHSLEEPGQDAVDEEQQPPARAADTTTRRSASKPPTQLYTISYLILFSIIGTLARVGLKALTAYPGAPISFTVIWANFGGCIVMGFLSEDQMLFSQHDYRDGRSGSSGSRSNGKKKKKKVDEETGPPMMAVAAAEKKAHMALKKTIPLYIGLATGFCGSFTSFSSYIADAFFAISDDLPTAGVSGTAPRRGGGDSLMALLAVVISTASLSISGLFLGAHLATGLDPWTPSLRYSRTHRVLDPLAVFLGWGAWIGAVFLAVFPPHDVWRGRVVFSLVFAPPGCLARFYLSARLNARIPSFPLGTFCANILGTAILGMAWDIAHVPVGGVVGCQVLQGVEDGFCGCLTTVSTWGAELITLRRRHSYVYGSTSVAAALAVMIAIMGGLRWSHGFQGLLCST
ncbi:CrcB-like protein [Geosmithia morbida]|uniref:CrcB-like protein n=1 Tax=Geosmithia morbida TaxID=1094350 RepID=A0A9P4YNI4_9HYPO|nr:CrcB-like protein [Geosmithia morbida]KAF4119712.1 CrcB-like protein [Geosmithia morbida]